MTRCLPLLRLAALSALVYLTLGLVPAQAQQCPPQIIHGDVTIADGSQPMTGATDAIYPRAPFEEFCNYAPGGGQGPFPLPGAALYEIPYQPFPPTGSGSFCVEAHGWAYVNLDLHGNGSYTCQPGNPCPTCSGTFSIPAYAEYGTFRGHIKFTPSGLPVPNAAVSAFAPGTTIFVGATSADLQGNYKFNYKRDIFSPFVACTIELCDSNNWGLRLGHGSPPGPLRESFDLLVTAGGSGAVLGGALTKETSSSKAEKVDFEVWDPDAERPDARTCPAVGNPVCVASGNAFFDQTDAELPGVASDPLRFVRSYNSLNLEWAPVSLFGLGWSSSYERRVTQPDPDTILLRSDDGTVGYFQHLSTSPAGVFEATYPFTTESRIVRQGDQTFVREFRTGGNERYQAIAQGGRLTSMTDPVGNLTAVAWSAGRLQSVTDAGGRQLSLAYPNANTVTLTGPAGLIATYTLTNGLLTAVVYADGDDAGSQPDGGYTFEYDTASRLLFVKDADGKVVEHHEYEAGSFRATVSEKQDHVERFFLSYELLKTTVTDANQNVSVYELVDAGGMRRVSRSIVPCPSCSGGQAIETWTYNGHGQVLTHVDANGYLTDYTYDDATGDLLSEERQVDQAGSTHVTGYTYYASGPGIGRLHTVTAPNGAVTTLGYDGTGDGPSSISSLIDGSRTRDYGFTYVPAGQPGRGKVQFVSDPRQKTWELHYFSSGDVEWVKDPLGNQTSFTYDLMGRRRQPIPPAVTAIPGTPTDPPLVEKESTYDTLGRPIKERNPDDSTFTTYTYDGGGHLSSVTDALQRLTQYTYDAYGRLWKITDPLNGVTEYGYDAASNLVSIRDAKLHTTTFVPDSANRIQKVCYHPDPGEPDCQRYDQYTYDAAGQVKTRRDRRAIVTTFTYDGLGRLTSKDYSDGAPAATFTYDGLTSDQKGRLTRAVSQPFQLDWSYDLIGEPTTVTRTRTGQGTSIDTLQYTYDDAGNRETLVLNGAPFVSYGWNDRGQLESLLRLPDRTFIFTYDEASRRKKMAFPNGVTTAYGYDARSRLASVAAAGAAAITDFAYPLYDAVDNRKSRTGSTAPAEAYNYDALDRLRDVQRTPPPAPSEVYTYDAVGNRQTALGLPTWTYSNRNELTFSGNGSSGTSYLYDLNGNMLQKTVGANVWTYEWDAENRLTRTRKNGVVMATYGYDALGRRAERTDKGGGNHLHAYVYDGEDIVRETEAPPLNPDVSGNAHIYVHGPGIDEPLAEERVSGEIWYYHADGLGSIVRVSDPTGAEVASKRRQYDAFGKLEASSNVQQGYTYTAREWDPEVGTYYYRARHYDPGVGRFLSEDPIGFSAGTNFFAYVRNNPVNRTDPMGLQDGLIDRIKKWYEEEEAPYLPEDFRTPSGIVIHVPPVKVRAGMVFAGPRINLVGGGCLTGFTRHGMNRLIQRGVSPQQLLNALKNPQVIIEQASGTIKYIGNEATVILNDAGRVVTTWLGGL